MKRTKSVRVYCVTRTEKSTAETGRGEATAETQDLRRRGGEETEGWRKKNNVNTEEPEKKNLRM